MVRLTPIDIKSLPAEELRERLAEKAIPAFRARQIPVSYTHLDVYKRQALDPTPAAVARAAGKYRYKLLIKTVNTARLRELVGRLLTEANRKPENKALTVYADINPAGML